MKLLWLDGWADIQTGEVNINIKSFHSEEEKRVIKKAIRELKKGLKKSLNKTKIIMEGSKQCYSRNNKYEDCRKDYQICLKNGKAESQKKIPAQKGGYNEYIMR